MFLNSSISDGTYSGFVVVMENLECHRNKNICIPDLESDGVFVQVLESHGN